MFLLLAGARSLCAAEPEPIADWPLTSDARDQSGNGYHLSVEDVEFSTAEGDDQPSAVFNGRTSRLSLEAERAPQFGDREFSITARVWIDSVLDDVPGDIISRFDPNGRRGFQLSIVNAAGVTSSQSNWRTLHFGIDSGTDPPEWTDHGRLGEAVLIFGMAVHDGQLFAGTCEAGVEQSGRVFRYDGGAWHDCGSPHRANAVSSLAVYQNELYVAASKYRLRGSALTESENPHVGGAIYKYVADGNWEHCVQKPVVCGIALRAGGPVPIRGGERVDIMRLARRQASGSAVRLQRASLRHGLRRGGGLPV
jgi:hypothetical protein